MSRDRLPRETLAALPKAELHVHLDGSLRPQTMLELADAAGIPLPAKDADELAAFMHVTEGRDLVEYLARFDVTIALMQDAAAIERIAYELAADSAAENVRYTEVRFCPLLHTRTGLTGAQAVEAASAGLERASAEFGIRTAIIVCGLRTLPVQTSIEMAQLAVEYRHRGVVAFDLAGAERGNPPIVHEPAFRIAAAANMAVTIHAGEAFGPASIHQAIHSCSARRIGHGTRLWEDQDLLDYVNDFRIPLEVCLTSNVQTQAAPSLEAHPLRRYYDEGLVVTLNTDNRLMSRTTLTDEYLHAHEALGFTWTELRDITLMGFNSAFLPWHEKQDLLERVRTEIDAISS